MGDRDAGGAATAGRGSEAVRVRLLGGFRVAVGARSIEEDGWPLRKAGGLLKLLALAPGHRLHRERAMDLLWPDLGPKAAANNLHHALHVARRTLEPDAPAASGYMSLRSGLLALSPDGPLWVDVEAFEDAARAARRSREPAAYRAAIDLYAGDLLPGDPYEGWAEGRRTGLRETYLALLAEVAGIHEERGELAPAAEALRRLAAEEPAREEAHAGLMRLYAAGGERGRAIDQYEHLKDVLRRELGIAPGPTSERLYQEIQAGRAAEPGPAAAPAGPAEGAPRHNLPTQRTSFVGRERELLEVRRDLAMTRLLTLTGPGGAGKTRLALEAAGDLVGAYPDGVWLAELAPLSEPDLVWGTAASALGVREQPGRSLEGTLAEVLGDKNLLLVLDNCEHLVDASARLADSLLGACPRLRILATSREALGVAGEVNRPVPPLPLPDPGSQPTAEELEGYGSARLFVERALYRPSSFALTPENAGAVAEICRKLDGIPLAIELAAARVGALAVEQISERLSESLALLTGGARTATPRQRTLRGSLDWSHELLVGPEKELFGRLSVFAGGWTLEAAEAVGGGGSVEEASVLDLLSRLVDKSLVVAEVSPGSPPRYGMLEPVRQYARERLERSGMSGATMRRHAAFYLALAEEAEPALEGKDNARWVDLLETEHPNLRAALSWSLEADPETSLRISGAVWRFWQMRGHLSEGRRWLEETLAAEGVGSPPVRARALRAVGALAWTQGDYGRATTGFEESLALSREAGERRTAARALNGLGSVARDHGDHARAKAHFQESLALWREIGDDEGASHALQNLGGVAFYQEDYPLAARFWEESLALYREMGEKYGCAISLNNLGEVARIQGDYGRAEEIGREGLSLFRDIDDPWAIFQSMISLGRLALALDDHERAARLFGAADSLREAIGAALSPPESADYDENVAAARSALGEEAFAAAWDAGSALAREDAVEYALGRGPAASEKADLIEPSSPLTRREEEVAALAARGLTNRRVAEELSISEHTAATHVRRILRKLGLSSRSQLAAWTTEQRTPDTDLTVR